MFRKPLSDRAPVSLDFVAPDLFDAIGGISRISRAMALALSAWAERRGLPLSVSVLMDSSGERDERYLSKAHGLRVFAGDRLSLARHVLTRAWSEPGRRLFVFAHPNLATLAAAFPPGTRSASVAHGIDVWTPLSLPRRVALRRVDRLWPVSADTGRHLIETQGLAPTKVRVVHNALDPFWPLPELDGSRPREHLLAVSRLHPGHAYKGIDLTIEALARIPVERRLPFVVCGDGPDRPRLEALARTLRVDVRFAGRVPDSKVGELFRRAAAFVMPSTGEGFGLVYLEAMAFGLPCVAARAGGAPEVVLDGETGLVIAPGDLGGLVNAIEAVTGEAGVGLGRRGRERLEARFLFRDYRERVFEALDELVDGRSTNPVSQGPLAG